MIGKKLGGWMSVEYGKKPLIPLPDQCCICMKEIPSIVKEVIFNPVVAAAYSNSKPDGDNKQYLGSYYMCKKCTPKHLDWGWEA